MPLLQNMRAYLSSVTSEKLCQTVQCLHQHRYFFLIQCLYHCVCHLFMKFFVMMVCFYPLFRQTDIHHSPIFLTPNTLCILLLHKAIHRSCQRTNGNIELFCNCRHIITFTQPNCFDNVHIIIGDIFVLFCNNRLLFQLPYFIKQMNQNIVNCLVCIQIRTPLPFFL